MLKKNGKIKKANEYIFVGLFLAVILFVFFAQAFTSNLSLVPAETIYHIDNVYQGLAEHVKDMPSNGLLSDLVYQMYPWRHFLSNSLSQGFIPLWNPYVLCGLPFLANDQSSIFELTKLISYFFRVEAKSFLLFSGFITLFLAGFFTYLFTRNLKINRLGSLVSCLAFMFSGPLIVWLGYPLSSVVIWLPLILLAIDKLIVSNSKIWFTVFAAAVAFQFMAGNPEVSWFILLLAAAYTLFRLLQLVSKKNRLKLIFKKTGILCLAFLLGLTLAAVQLLPTLEFIQQSDAFLVGRGGLAGHSFFEAAFQGEWNSWRSLEDTANSFYEIPLLLFPDYFGSPVLKEYWGVSNYNESAMHIGFIALVFSFLALFYLFKKNKKRNEIIFWLSVSLVALGIFSAWPILKLAGFLPVFKVVALGRLRFIFVFALAVLSGYGVHWLTKKASAKEARKKLAYFNIIFFALAAFLRYRFIVDEVDLAIRTEQKMFVFFLFVFVNLSLILILFGFSKLKKYLGYILLITLIVIELFSYSIDYHPTIEPKLVFPKTHVIEYLEKNIGHHRLTNFRLETERQIAALQPNSSLLWQLQDVRGYEIVKLYRYESFERHFMQADKWLLYKLYDQKVFNLMGVKYFVQEDNQQENQILDKQESLKKVSSNGTIEIYQNLDTLPRAFVVFNIHPIKDFFVAKDVFFMESFRPDMTAIIETENPEYLMRGYRNNPSTPYREARIVSYLPNRVVIETDTDKDGYLVLTDVYDGGWQAFVDGQPKKIYPTNVAFRGLFIPSGKHTIVFEYLPKSYLYGSWLSLISLVISIFLIILWIVKKVKIK